MTDTERLDWILRKCLEQDVELPIPVWCFEEAIDSCASEDIAFYGRHAIDLAMEPTE